MRCIIKDSEGNSGILDLKFTKDGRGYFVGQSCNIELIDFLTISDYVELEYAGENHIYEGWNFEYSHQLYDRKDNLYFKLKNGK